MRHNAYTLGNALCTIGKGLATRWTPFPIVNEYVVFPHFAS